MQGEYIRYFKMCDHEVLEKLPKSRHACGKKWETRQHMRQDYTHQGFKAQVASVVWMVVRVPIWGCHVGDGNKRRAIDELQCNEAFCALKRRVFYCMNPIVI
jgi:hypothetical protein